MNKFEEMQEEARAHLEKLNGAPVMNTPEAVLRVCKKAMEHGTWDELVWTKYWKGQWFWAEYEKKYHAAHEEAK